ncbi:MAG: alpha/beta hydrolase [Gammaproteobacteria bacterium]|nr:alpha/beta hydrolase [Gammaproteobacteria bacterium]
MDNETKNLLEQFNQQVPETNEAEVVVDMNRIRAGAREMFLSLAGETHANGKVESIDIPALNYVIPARVYYPEQEKPDGTLLPTVIFLHGGGWSLGDLDCYHDLMRALADLSGAIFISVDYRLSPEFKYPSGLDDAYDATRWVFDNVASLGGDHTKLAIMGDSAGGNLALIVAHRLHQNTLLRLVALYLIYPVLDVHSPHETYQSRLDFGDGQYLRVASLKKAGGVMAGVAGVFLGAQFKPTRKWLLGDPEISPMFLPMLEQLPTTTILVAGYDPLRDEGDIFAGKLKRAGSLARFNCFDSTIHAFLSFGVLDVSQQARQYLANAIQTDLFS